MAHHSIERLSVTGGFLDGMSIELADGLNCFIGARGTGKTTALEFFRYGLDRMPDPRIDKDRKHDIFAPSSVQPPASSRAHRRDNAPAVSNSVGAGRPGSTLGPRR